jgi:hypothetical protein
MRCGYLYSISVFGAEIARGRNGFDIEGGSFVTYLAVFLEDRIILATLKILLGNNLWDL